MDARSRVTADQSACRTGHLDAGPPTEVRYNACHKHATYACVGCGMCTYHEGENFSVNTEVWMQAGLWRAATCVACFEDLIGRRLTREDFEAHTLEADHSTLSARLRDRLTRAVPPGVEGRGLTVPDLGGKTP